MTNESVIIKDDIISPAYQDLVATAVDNYDAAWYLGGDQDEYQGWATHYLKDDQILNNTYFLLVPILLEAVHKALDSKDKYVLERLESYFEGFKKDQKVWQKENDAEREKLLKHGIDKSVANALANAEIDTTNVKLKNTK